MENNESKLFFSKFVKVASLICAVMVIGIHAYNIPEEMSQWSVSARIVGTLSHGLFTSAVPIFYIVSGYLFFCTADSVKDVFKKQKRRVRTLLVPCLCWSTLYFLMHLAINFSRGINILPDLTFTGVLKDIVFYRQEGTLWFLFQLILYVVLCPLLYYALKNRIVSTCLLAVVASLGILGIKLAIPLDGVSQTIFSFNSYFYFFLGAWLAVNVDLPDLICRLSRLNPVFVIVGLVVFSFCGGLLFDIIPIFNHRLLVPVVAFFTIALSARLTAVIPDGKGLTRLFAIPTLVVYGMHQMFMRVLVQVLPRFIPWPIAVYFIVITVTSVICGALALLVKKIRFTNYLLNGGR